MISKSIYNKKIYNYTKEKRYGLPRIPFSLDVYYPRVNNKSVSTNLNSENDFPIMKAINLSENGICFISKIHIQTGDFINFLIKIEDAPSFSCTAEVRWVGFDDHNYLLGCRLISLSLDQIHIIRDYIKHVNNTSKE